MKIITIASYPRTGSSLLLHLLNRFNVTGLLEIFHSNPVVARNHLAADEAIKTAPGLIQNYTRELITQDPLALLEAIAAIKRDSKAIVFKIFPGHLPEEKLAEVIAKSDALVIHSRNRVHSHISDIIATRLGSWSHIPTSDQFIDFNPDRFKHYSRHVHHFLTTALRLAIDNRTAITFSSHEALMNASEPDAMVRELLTVLLGSNEFGAPAAAWLPKQQDTRLLATEKVSNPGKLLTFLEEQNLMALNDASFDIPFIRYASIH